MYSLTGSVSSKSRNSDKVKDFDSVCTIQIASSGVEIIAGFS